MASVLSRRERIMVELARRAAEITEGHPVSDPFRVTFGVITRGGSLEGLHETQRYGLAIVDTDESKTPKIQQVTAVLTVAMEFSAWVSDGEQPSTTGNRVMADLQRKFREDLNLTEPDDGVTAELDRQLSENVVEVRNQLFIDGFADRKISGAVFWNITYKHFTDDPRALTGSLT